MIDNYKNFTLGDIPKNRVAVAILTGLKHKDMSLRELSIQYDIPQSSAYKIISALLKLEIIIKKGRVFNENQRPEWKYHSTLKEFAIEYLLEDDTARRKVVIF